MDPEVALTDVLRVPDRAAHEILAEWDEAGLSQVQQRVAIVDIVHNYCAPPEAGPDAYYRLMDEAYGVNVARTIVRRATTEGLRRIVSGQDMGEWPPVATTRTLAPSIRACVRDYHRSRQFVPPLSPPRPPWPEGPTPSMDLGEWGVPQSRFVAGVSLGDPLASGVLDPAAEASDSGLVITNPSSHPTLSLTTPRGPALVVSLAGPKPPWTASRPGDSMPVLHLGQGDDGVGEIWMVLYARNIVHAEFAFYAYVLYRIGLTRAGYCVGLVRGERSATVEDSTALDLLRSCARGVEADVPLIDRILECADEFLADR